MTNKMPSHLFRSAITSEKVIKQDYMSRVISDHSRPRRDTTGVLMMVFVVNDSLYSTSTGMDRERGASNDWTL